MQLYIGNKNYSSWSLRAWLLLRQAGIAFDEVPLRLSFNGDSDFKRALAAVSPAGRVPVLVDDGFGSGTRSRSPSTWPSAIPKSSSGRRIGCSGPARAACAPKCIPASARCATTAP